MGAPLYCASMLPPPPAFDCSLPVGEQTEWLEADGLGGFASGTASGIRTRRYQALLLAANHPPADRWVLVNGFSAWLETPKGPRQLTPQHYAPGVTTGVDAEVECFEAQPWPRFRYVTHDGLVVVHEVLVQRGSPTVLLSFRLEMPASPPGIRLCVRPLLSGRDFHHLHKENAAFRWEPEPDGDVLRWVPYAGVPAIRSWSNGAYVHAPDWYRRFLYAEELKRGLDNQEDLASPGILQFELSREEARWQLSAETTGGPPPAKGESTSGFDAIRRSERERRAALRDTPLLASMQAYLVPRGEGATIIAGYPWFGDWGRDTFIAVRGACLATGHFEAARTILLQWAHVVSEGMLPNRFPDHSDEAPEYNAVDASLWYVIAANELCAAAGAQSVLSVADKGRLEAAMREIVLGYAAGTRFGIRADTDGLLACGAEGTQLTWMDAKAGGRVVTPRWGKPVEIQALWINALHAVAPRVPEVRELLRRASGSFEPRFWNDADQALYDVVDVEGRASSVDTSFRPNQIFALGGLPLTLVSQEKARRALDNVERRLWTPMGLRSLAPDHPAYRGRYAGGSIERDASYHQGTVWLWLTGAFVEAWLKARGGGEEAKRTARERFLAPLVAHLSRAGVGHASEIADGDPPHTPGGCPFQAWSLSELLRLRYAVLA